MESRNCTVMFGVLASAGVSHITGTAPPPEAWVEAIILYFRTVHPNGIIYDMKLHVYSL